MSDALDFGVDLKSVRERVEGLKYFVRVSDIQNATIAIEQGTANPPEAFVSVASETALPNKIMGSNNKAQRVEVTISILFAENAARGDGEESDVVEQVRRAVVRQCMNWTPDGAIKSLEYDRYLLRGMFDGVVYGEVLFRTAYRLEG